ncbi:YbaK/EbsC family protein [Brevibacterium otitidis]|uniref:YbaK/EbsC family protein n=1 Tax=Brevibacterium otitidis TaxID=53364 RepID=A0ABV5WXZ5_9MICO|nr:YbaK/EbsC family protein [Brevibacterium otitidis]
MHARNAAVARDLEAAGIDSEITLLSEQTNTAKAAAAYLGIEVGAIANSLIFDADGEAVLIITSGRHRVDTDYVAGVIGAQKLGRASADLVKEATGQVIGGVAPCGHPAPVRTYIDTALRDYPELWAAAGTADSMMPLTYEQLVTLTGGQEISVEP